MFARLLTHPLLICLLAVAVGACIDALVKGIAPDAGLHQLLAWRFLFGSILSLAVFRARKRPMPSGAAIRFHTMRGALQLVSVSLFFFAITVLPLAEITVIGFTAALLVPFLAGVILAEKPGAVAVIAAVVGFAGAALAVSGTPAGNVTPELRNLGLTAGFMSAFCYALMLILLRMRAKTEDATTIAMFSNVVPAVALLPVTFGVFGAPTWSDLPLFLLLGCMGYSVWVLMSLAYARAPAQRLAPLEYTALIWSALLGGIFFREVPGWQLWAGGAVIIAACLIVAVDDHFATRKAARLPMSDLP